MSLDFLTVHAAPPVVVREGSGHSFLFFVFYFLVCFHLDKCPAFESFDDKVLLWCQWFVRVGATVLRSALVQVTVQPQAELSVSGTDRQTLRVALDEVKVLPAPVEHLEVGVELVQQRFARTVEVVRHVQRAGCEGTKHIVLRIFYDYQDWAFQFVHLSVQRVQRETVQRSAEHQGPRVALGTCWQVGAEFFPMLLAEDLRLADQVRNLEVLIEGTGCKQRRLPVVICAHRQNLGFDIPGQAVDL